MRGKDRTFHLCISAVFMAIILVLSSVSIPVPGGHFYLNDVPIILAAILLDPLSAALVAGFGAFLGDVLFYPAPMFVSLVTHFIQGLVISVCAHNLWKSNKKAASLVGAILGGIIVVVGYSLGKIYVYSTFEYAMLKLPFEIAQSITAIILGWILCWKMGIYDWYQRIVQERARRREKMRKS